MTTLVKFILAHDADRRKDLTILAVLFGLVFFLFLGHIPLIDPDEGRYAEIPREMLERGDFITPFLNYVKYFEKPVLLYWLNALSFGIFGQNEFAARFPSALSGLLTVLLTYVTGREIFSRRVGMMAALILGTSVGFLVQARYNITDMILTFCMTATLACFIMAAKAEGRRQGRYYYLMYFFAALTVLAKGLIGIVLPVMVIFGYILLSRRWSIFREMRLLTGTILFILVAAPWFVLVSLKNPEFARFFFIHEHFERFLTKVHKRYEPPWFFIPVLVGCMLPWSFFIPSGVLLGWRERRADAGALLYLALWVVLIFGFFSVSSSKLIPYILPVFPAVALLIGWAFSIVADRPGRIFTGAVAVLGVVLCIMGAGLIAYPWAVAEPDLTRDVCLVGGVLLALEGVVLLGGWKRWKAGTLFMTLALFSLAIEVAVPPMILYHFAEKRSAKGLGAIVNTVIKPGAVLAGIVYDHSLSFYTGQRVVIVGGKGELEFGSEQGDNREWFIDWPRFLELWNGPRQVLFVVEKDLLPLLQGSLGRFTTLGGNEKKYLITNQ